MAGTTQYNATAKVPDITNLITCISPDDTPLSSMMGTASPATQVLHSWEEEELRGPEKNAQVEGFVYETKEIDPTDLRSNVTQSFFAGCGFTDAIKAVIFQKLIGYVDVPCVYMERTYPVTVACIKLLCLIYHSVNAFSCSIH